MSVTDGSNIGVVLDACRTTARCAATSGMETFMTVKTKGDLTRRLSKRPGNLDLSRQRPHPLFRVNNEAGANDGLQRQQISAALLLLFPRRVRNTN